jgi:hypothetical protein
VAPGVTVALGLVTEKPKSMPDPLSATVWGLPAAESLRLMVPVRGPGEVGVKVTRTAHVPPMGTEWQVLLVTVKSPTTPMPLKLSVWLPVFVTVIVCAELATPTTEAANFTLEGLTLAVALPGPQADETVTLVEPQISPVQAFKVADPTFTPKTTPLLVESFVMPLLLPESFVMVAMVLSEELQIADTKVCVLESLNVPVAAIA